MPTASIQVSNIHLSKPVRAAIEHLRGHNDTDGWNNLEQVLGMNVDWHWLGEPIYGKTLGRHNMIVSCKGYLLDPAMGVIDTQSNNHATLASTVNDGGLPEGSTELDTEAGCNCQFVTTDEYKYFLDYFLKIRPGTRYSAHSHSAFINMYHNDLDDLCNTTKFIHTCDYNIEEGTYKDIAEILCRFVMFHGGWAVLKPAIIHRAFANKVNNIRGDTGIYQRRLVKCSKVLTNHHPFWHETQVISNDCFPNLPPAVVDIIQILQAGHYTTDTRGGLFYHDRITAILLKNLEIEYDTVEDARMEIGDKAIEWYRDHFVHADNATDETAFTNGLFKAFGFDGPGQYNILSPASFGMNAIECGMAPLHFGDPDDNDEENNNPNQPHTPPNNKPIPKSVFDSDDF